MKEDTDDGNLFFDFAVRTTTDKTPPISVSRHWTRYERKIWLFTFFCAGAMLYAARTVMPVCVVKLSQEYSWNKTQTGTVLSAFFWGYTMTQVIGGCLADRYGGEVVISAAAIGWSFFTLITPQILRICARNHVLFYAVVSRVIIGCFQGLYYPSLSSLFSRRILESERAFSFSFATSGAHFGTLISGVIGSLLLDNIGWPYPFYCIGALGIFWLTLYQLKMVGIDHTAGAKKDVTETPPIELSSPGLPWCKLFKKLPFWAILIGQFCGSWTFFILLSWLPTYFYENFPLSKGWVFNVVPWVFSLPCQWFSGWLADYLIIRGCSTSFVRKFIQMLSFCGAGIFLFLLSYMESYIGALICMTVAIGFCAFHHSGISVNAQDIAPNFAGSVFGLQNTAGAIPGFIGVYITGYILDTTKSWSTVFNLTSFLCFFGCFIFTIFGTGKRVI